MINTIRLQQELARSKMKQRDLAEKVGVTEVSMSRYFNGSRMPRHSTLVAISKALNTTPDYLTDIEGLNNPDSTFAKTRINIKTYGNRWTYAQQRELVNELLNAIHDRLTTEEMENDKNE